MNEQKNLRVRFAVAFGLQFLGTLGVLGLSYWWLTWPDEETWQVVASFVSAIVIVLIALCMQCSVLGEFYERPAGNFGQRLLRLLPAFAMWTVVFALCEIALLAFYSNVEQYAVRLAQILSLPPRAATAVLNWSTWAAIWILLPALLLPLGSLVSRDGFAALRPLRLRESLGVLGNLRHWAITTLGIMFGAYLPYKLVNWIPDRETLRGEVWSAVLRLSTAYVIAVIAIVVLSWSLARTISARAKAEETA